MNISNNQIFVIIVSVLMITSIIGFAVWMSPNRNQSQPSDSDTTPNVLPKLAYTANDIPATVHKLLPILKISAYSTEPNITVIDKALVSLNNVLNVSSSFKNEQGTGKLIYTADIVMKSVDTNVLALISEIEESTLLNNVFAARKAILKLPAQVDLFNADLNMHKLFAFQPPYSEGVIEIDSIEGDELKILLQVLLQGEQVVQSQAFELKNVSLTPINLSTNAKAKVVSLTPSLVFSGEFDYNGFDITLFQANLVFEIPDINFVHIQPGPFLPKAKLLIDLNAMKEKNIDKNALMIDLNATCISKESVCTFSTDLDKNHLVMDATLPSTKNYSDFILTFNDLIKQKGLLEQKEFTFVPQRIYVEGEIQVEHVNNETLITAYEILSEAIKAQGMNLKVFNVVLVSLLEDLTVEETSYQFNNIFRALVLPDIKENEEVDLIVNFQIQRNKVVLAQGIEPLSSVVMKKLEKIFTGYTDN